MKTVLITGGAGFIGSNFVKMMLNKHPEYKIINVDALTYAGNLENLTDIADNKNYFFIKTDIRDREAIEKIFKDNEIDLVVNFAAESHVDRSIEDPEVFLTTNIMGTQVLLDTAKKHWKINPDDKYSNEYKEGVKFLQVSTDCEAIDTVLHKGTPGEVYNIGGNNEKANIEIIKLIISNLGKSEDLIKYVKDRPGHDRRYAIDNTKITTELGWKPAYTFEQGMKETIQWYLNNTGWIDNIVNGNYIGYYEKMYRS